MRRSRIRFIVHLAGLLALSGAGARAQGVEGTATRAAAAFPRPGDLINLRFLREEELSDTLGVNERGEAVFPKLGVVQVSGIRIAHLRDSLRARYKQYLREPELEAWVLRRIVVNGAVQEPNVYYVDLASGVRDAIAMAGGITEFAKRRDVTIIRGGERIRLRDWERAVGPDADLMSGDEIVVGRRSWLAQNSLGLISTGVLVVSLVASLSR